MRAKVPRTLLMLNSFASAAPQHDIVQMQRLRDGRFLLAFAGAARLAGRAAEHIEEPREQLDVRQLLSPGALGVVSGRQHIPVRAINLVEIAGNAAELRVGIKDDLGWEPTKDVARVVTLIGLVARHRSR